MRVLVTGATGFIGRHAAAAFAARGHTLDALSTSERPAQEGVRWHRADLHDPAQTAALIARTRPTHLLHLAWSVEHGEFWTSPENERWVAASLGLLDQFAKAGGQRVVISGTCAEYDWARPPSPLEERRSPIDPHTPYGVAKHALHEAAAERCAAAGVQLAWGRVFFLFGEGEDPRRLVPSVARSVLAGRAAPCTHGRQLRDFLHSSDVADAFVALLLSDASGPVNIASGEAVTIAQLVELVATAAGAPELVELGRLPARPDDPPELVADATRLRQEVGWAPRLSLSDAVERTVRWWREHDAP